MMTKYMPPSSNSLHRLQTFSSYSASQARRHQEGIYVTLTARERLRIARTSRPSSSNSYYRGNSYPTHLWYPSSSSSSSSHEDSSPPPKAPSTLEKVLTFLLDVIDLN